MTAFVRRGFAVASVALAIAFVPAAPAQSAAECDQHWLASPTVRSGAWTESAVRWMQDRGGLAGWPLPQGRIPAAVAACLFVSGGAVDDDAVTEIWSHRLHSESGRAAAPQRQSDPAISARIGAGVAGLRGHAAPGAGLVGEGASGAEYLPEARGLAAAGWTIARAGRLFVFVEVDGSPDAGIRLQGGDVGVQIGPFGVAAGRAEVAYGSGGLVFSGRSPLDRVEIATLRPLPAPGPLAFIGPVAGHTFLARLSDVRHAGSPLLWGGSITLQPSPRFEIGLHRGMMLGGDAPTTPLTPATLLHAFLGRHNDFRGEYVGDVRNQILSVDARYRLPLHGIWPTTVYIEWGTEDSAGGFRDVPGIVAGLRSSPLLGQVPMTIGLEQIYMGEGHRRGNPPWYRHGIFQGGWVSADLPLGHPLGGHGREWAAYLWADTPGGARMDARLMTRSRGSLNLFVPGWEGRSRALDFSGAWAVQPGVDLAATSLWERGEGWQRWQIRAGVEASFR